MDITELKLKFEIQLATNVSEMEKIRSFRQLRLLLDKYGYFEGAKRLINGKETLGLRDLILADRVDLSIEYLALLEEFHPLFSEDELKKCKRKLDI
ncbi:hypothetical protein F3J23_16805 [Chryseobacterium sp. Tr-659]|uniref:hypothetical protein n=1 Tax=Chryseobacterium sp. Tr-659 TaxID=2608340 RepID=UPI00141E9BC3|nr:hypothetical protein [Chryseobacterium sp. Tr-659]NIF07099.1 hypothetical protein [Chryseobacterium sp. Tr-659]